MEQLAAAVTPSTNEIATPATQTQTASNTEPQPAPPVILPGHSVVFSMRPNYGTPEQQAAKMAALSSYRSQMVMNPVELMMLSQLDTPGANDKKSVFF